MTGLNEIENVYGETVEFYDLSALSQIGNKKIVLNKFADMVKDLDGIILDIGAGTGKTTIIKTVIELYEKQGKKVVLCAPTGRAAKRMTETKRSKNFAQTIRNRKAR